MVRTHVRTAFTCSALTAETKMASIELVYMLSAAITAITLTISVSNVLFLQLLAKRRKLGLLAALQSGRRSFKKTKRRRKRRFWVKPGRTDSWWENMIQDRCLDEDWKKNFRMGKGSFVNLVDELRPYITPDQRAPRPCIPAEKRVRYTNAYHNVISIHNNSNNNNNINNINNDINKNNSNNNNSNNNNNINDNINKNYSNSNNNNNKINNITSSSNNNNNNNKINKNNNNNNSNNYNNNNKINNNSSNNNKINNNSSNNNNNKRILLV